MKFDVWLSSLLRIAGLGHWWSFMMNDTHKLYSTDFTEPKHHYLGRSDKNNKTPDPEIDWQADNFIFQFFYRNVDDYVTTW